MFEAAQGRVEAALVDLEDAVGPHAGALDELQAEGGALVEHLQDGGAGGDGCFHGSGLRCADWAVAIVTAPRARRGLVADSGLDVRVGEKLHHRGAVLLGRLRRPRELRDRRGAIGDEVEHEALLREALLG